MLSIKGLAGPLHPRTADKPSGITWKALLAWDSIFLLSICLADMLSTLYFVHAHMAVESNPVMAYWLNMGDGAFCVAKVLSFLPLLFVAAYYRQTRPKLVQLSLRGAIVLYLAIYVVAVGSQGIMHA